jgi:nucleolar protein 9
MITLLRNVYKEIEGKELLLACDCETSRVLEKILLKSSDLQLRIFVDRLSGHYITLSRDRFASHIIQTLLSLAVGVVDRELSSGVKREEMEAKDPRYYKKAEAKEEGILLSMQDLVLILAEQFLTLVNGQQEDSPTWLDLMFDAYASHVLRALIATLSGVNQDSLLRSKASMEFNKEHHIINAEDAFICTVEAKRVPTSFTKMKGTLLHVLFDDVEITSFRKIVFHASASPILQVKDDQ